MKWKTFLTVAFWRSNIQVVVSYIYAQYLKITSGTQETDCVCELTCRKNKWICKIYDFEYVAYSHMKSVKAWISIEIVLIQSEH